MRYALDLNGNKIETEFSGQRAICPGCQGEVTGKIYRNKKNHWAHLRSDCDSWYEPMSEWHIKWQNHFPKENQEVIMYDEKKKIFHRADIRLNNGAVIEIQNSPIAIKEVSQRENFYNQKGLVWILNAKNLIPKSKFMNFIFLENCEIRIKFFKPYYWEYISDNIIDDLRESYLFNTCLYRRKNTNNGFTEYIFESKALVDPELTRDDISKAINSSKWNISNNDYNKESELFSVKIITSKSKARINKFLDKLQWKSFIDKMTAPVFLDNVTDLDSKYLYWVQKEKIIKKGTFLNRILSK